MITIIVTTKKQDKISTSSFFSMNIDGEKDFKCYRQFLEVMELVLEIPKVSSNIKCNLSNSDAYLLSSISSVLSCMAILCFDDEERV
jgi:hypothetical protein